MSNRLQQYYLNRYAKCVNGYIRNNVNSLYKLFVPNDISNIIVKYYPIFLSCNVWVIGRNHRGEFGIGHTDQINKLISCKWNKDIKSIDHIYKGLAFFIFKTSTNEFYSAGKNKQAQCGVGHRNTNTSITEIKYFTNNTSITIVKVCSGNYGHSTLWITSDGKLYGNGFNNFGIKNNQLTITSPVLVDYFSVNKLKVIDAATSKTYSLVLCDNGCVYSCGQTMYSENGQYLNSKSNSNEWKQIESLKHHKIIQIEAGKCHSLFLTLDGNIFSCGKNNYGQLGIDTVDDEIRLPTKVTYFEQNDIEIDKISCAYLYNIALSKNGKVYSWGYNQFGQCGHGHTVKFVPTPSIINAFIDEYIIDIECGAGYLCVLTVNGDCFIWGKNDYHQCCEPSDNKKLLLKPVKINKYLPKNKMIKQISLGWNSTAMILSDVVAQ